MLPKKSIHFLAHLVAKIDRAFNHFNHKALDQEILKLQKVPNESVDQFYTHFCNLAYRFPEDEIDWEFLYGRFEYLLRILNLAQHTSVMELHNHKQVQLLSQAML